jgi:L-serine/L-threonine ammonia-lyase
MRKQVEGAQWSEAHAAAGALAAACGGALIHPFEGEATWQGHASLVAETAAQLPHAAAGAPGAASAALASGGAPGAIVASVGGGGLLMGVLRGAEAAGWLATTTVVAAETIGADCLAQALAADALVTLPGAAARGWRRSATADVSLWALADRLRARARRRHHVCCLLARRAHRVRRRLRRRARAPAGRRRERFRERRQ